MKLVIGGSWDGAKRAVDATVKYAQSAGVKISGALNKVLSPLGVGIGVTAAVAGVKSLVNELDQIEESSKALGVTAEFYQRLGYAAERSGIGVERMRSSMAQLMKLAGEARQGKAKAQEFFAWMGIDPASLGSMSAEQLFGAVASAISGMKDQQTQAAVASRLFGDEFGKALEMLRDYKALGDEAAGKGLIFSDADVEAAAKVNDIMADIEKHLKNAVLQAGLLKGIANVAEGIDAATKPLPEGVKEVRKPLTTKEKLQNALQKSYIQFVSSALPGPIGALLSAAGAFGAFDKRPEVRYETGPTTGAELEKAKAERQKRIAEAAAAEAAKQKAAEAAAAAQAKRVADAEDGALKKLQDQLEAQRLINAGKEREVAIMQAVKSAEADAARAGGTLSDAARAKVAAVAGALFDAKQKPGAVKAGDFTNAFANWGVGGNLGGLGNVGGYATMGRERYTSSLASDVRGISAEVRDAREYAKKIYDFIRSDDASVSVAR